MSNATETRIPCSRETRRLVKSCKTGGETYDSLLQRLVEHYECADAPESGG